MQTAEAMHRQQEDLLFIKEVSDWPEDNLTERGGQVLCCQPIMDWTDPETPSDQCAPQWDAAILEIPRPRRDARAPKTGIEGLAIVDAQDQECCRSTGQPVQTSW